jgi:hypothetical protein
MQFKDSTDKRVNDFFVRLRREDAEKQTDTLDMLGLELEGCTSGAEMISDYADNLLIFIDIWADYLFEESFIRYGWIDLDEGFLQEIEFLLPHNYHVTFFIASVIFLLGFHYCCFLYMVFSIPWYYFDQDPESDPENPADYLHEISRFVHAKKAQHLQLKREHFMYSQGQKFLEHGTCWQIFHRLWIWRYNRYIIDDLPQVQLSKWLGRRAPVRNYFSYFVKASSEEIMLNLHSSHFAETLNVLSLIEKRKKKIKISLRAKSLLYDRSAKCLSDFINKSFKLKNSKILSHEVDPVELYFFNKYVSNWYFFKGPTPYKYRKHHYIL